MREHSKTLTFWEAGVGELSPVEQELIAEALRAREDAYAPYSKYQVGAAVLLDDGRMIRGSNQENAAYPSGLCAERVALFHIGANHKNAAIVAMAVATRKGNGLPAGSCGSCRQVMVEFEYRQKKPIKIIMANDAGQAVISSSVADLMPLSFEPDHLG